MTPMAFEPTVADTLAFVDESGARGYSRKLTPARDHDLGLVCALLVPAPRVEEFRNAFRPGYQQFVDAVPHDANFISPMPSPSETNDGPRSLNPYGPSFTGSCAASKSPLSTKHVVSQ